MAVEPGKELLWKYAFGQCESHEMSFVESWLKADPKNQKKLERIRLYESIKESNGGSQQDENEVMIEVKEEKPYPGYLLAFIIIIIVFILLTMYSYIKNHTNIPHL